MNEIKKTAEEFDSSDQTLANDSERLKNPRTLLNIHSKRKSEDEELSLGRAAIQELCDYVPPYDDDDLAEKGMSDRFNVNYGLAASIVSEAVGSYVDILMSADPIVKIALDYDVDKDQKERWANIMSVEFTKALRSWDSMISNFMLLPDIFVKQGVAIPMFEDKGSLMFDVYSLEECKFDPKAVAVPTRNEIVTIERTLSAVDLTSKIGNDEKATGWVGNWNASEIRRIIARMKPDDATDWTDFEETARMAKSGRYNVSSDTPNITIVWGIVMELNGKISVYAAQKCPAPENNEKDDIEFVYKKTNAYDDVNQVYQIFPFSIGNKNRIYTIRGLGYALYEAGMADNILRCKMMDAARHRATEVYHPESTIESPEDITFIDLGHALIAPKGLKGSEQFNRHNLDNTIGFALSTNQQMIARHSTGLAGSSISDNPNARRNEMQVTAELEHINKMSAFASTLFYPPLDKLLRELVRRAYQETQTDVVANKIVSKMKASCMEQGVPQDIFDRIDLTGTVAVRLLGAGSKGTRIIAYQQMAQMYAEMDDVGKEFFSFDFASEIMGSEKASRYFGIPGERREHVDNALAQLENNDLLEGQFIEPIDGENRIVHLRRHVEALVNGIEAVNEGSQDLVDWTMRNVPLYEHCVKTLELTTVHESRVQELNTYRQMVQQAGELIDNGMRSINRMKRDGEMADGEQAPEEQTQDGQQSDAEKDYQLRMAQKFAESKAKIEIMARESEAKRTIMAQESMAKIALMDQQTAAAIRRQQVLDRVKTR